MEFALSGYTLGVLSAGSICFGLWLLIKGGDWTIEAAVYIARKLGLSQLFIGATIVAFGTSVPELFTSVNANLSGYPGLAIGNVVGSNIANILLVVGIAAVIFAVSAEAKALRKDVAMVLAATALLIGLMSTGVVTQLQGLLMAGALIGYIVFQYFTDTGADHSDDVPEGDGINSMGKALLVLLGGLLALALGSEMLVQGAVSAGTALGVPEAVIGLTVVAFGTSLPEVTTCVLAALKRHTELIIGNILGSNLFNIMWIIGVTAAVKPMTVDPQIAAFDMWLMGGLTVVFGLWMSTVARVGRPLGIAMLVAYCGYVAYSYQDVIT